MTSAPTALKLQFSGLGKKYYQRWIFRDLSYELELPAKLAVIGSNGSGKSTLLRMLAGQLNPTEGNISFWVGNTALSLTRIYQHLSWSAPYLDLYEDLSLVEHLNLHFRFKKCLLPSILDLVDLLKLKGHADKKLRYYSSGMLQRVKVGIALFTQAELLLLDEPTSNMDSQNAQLMLDLIHQYSQDRILILASNMEREFAPFSQVIRLGTA